MARKFGWFVRFLHLMNKSWPLHHSSFNGASAATPPQDFHECLASRLPPHPSLILLEFASMGRHVRAVPTEALVRRLMLLPSRPHLLFVHVRRLCPDRGDEGRTAEEQLEKLAAHYHQSSISYHAAVAPGMDANLTGFELAHLAPDCVHPSKGALGDLYMTTLLSHWWSAALIRQQQLQHYQELEQQLRKHLVLPPPLYNSSVLAWQKKPRNERCFGFLEIPIGRATDVPSQASGATRMATRMAWRTTFPEAALSNAWLTPQSTSGQAHARPNLTSCPKSGTPFRHAPRGWFYCHTALIVKRGVIRRGKVSPGLVALLPGAALEVALVLSLRERSGSHSLIRLGIKFLTSYEHMGIVHLSCRGDSCSCPDGRIDAHRPRSQDSTFEQIELTIKLVGSWQSLSRSNRVSDIFGRCSLVVHVANDTSSGGHKFKLVRLSL